MRIPQIFNQEVPNGYSINLYSLNREYDIGDTVIKLGDNVGDFLYGVVARFFTVNGEKWIQFDSPDGEIGAAEPTSEWALATEEYVRTIINSRPIDYLCCMNDRAGFLDEVLYRLENKQEREVQNFMKKARENKKEFLRKQEENMKKEKDLLVKEKPKVITMCGSTKWKDDYMREYRRLVFEGNIVIASLIFSHADGESTTKEQKDFLDQLHLRKIDISDAIFVVNPGNYIGRSTINEIFYAHDHNKEVIYLE